MNVSKPDQVDEPGYPDKKQIAKNARKVGLAVVGVGILSSGCQPQRMGGVPRPIPSPTVKPMEGRTLGAFRPAPTPTPSPSGENSTQPRGKIRVEPTPTPSPTPKPSKMQGLPPVVPSPTPPRLPGTPVLGPQ